MILKEIKIRNNMERVVINSKNYREFKKFYNDIFIKNFANKDEYSSLDDIISLIKNGYYDSLESNILLYKIENDIVAGYIFNYFHSIKSIVIAFITVSKNFRNKRIGTMIIEDIINYIENFKNRVKYIFVEIEYDNKTAQCFWENLGFKRINFNYIQPNFPNKNPVNNIMLAVKTNDNYISSSIIKEFIIFYSKIAILIDDINNNESIQKMFKEMKEKERLNLIKIKS